MHTSGSSAGGPMSRISSAWSVLIRRPIVMSDIDDSGGSDANSHWTCKEKMHQKTNRAFLAVSVIYL